MCGGGGGWRGVSPSKMTACIPGLVMQLQFLGKPGGGGKGLANNARYAYFHFVYSPLLDYLTDAAAVSSVYHDKLRGLQGQNVCCARGIET